MKLKTHLIFASLLLVSASMSFSSCDGDNWEANKSLVLTDASHSSLTNGQIVATGDVIKVTTTSATILFSANYNYKEKLSIKPGILYTSLDPSGKYFTWDYTYSGTYYIYKPSYKTIGDFTHSECEVTLTGLKPLTTYYYRAYASKKGYYYACGEIKSFTTPAK